MRTNYNKRLTQLAQWTRATSLTPFGDTASTTPGTISCYAYENTGTERAWSNPIPLTYEWACLIPLNLINVVKEGDRIIHVTFQGQVIFEDMKIAKLLTFYHYSELRALVAGLERN